MASESRKWNDSPEEMPGLGYPGGCSIMFAGDWTPPEQHVIRLHVDETDHDPDDTHEPLVLHPARGTLEFISHTDPTKDTDPCPV